MGVRATPTPVAQVVGKGVRLVAMSDVALPACVPSDPPQRRLLRIAAWITGTLVALGLLHVAGIDVLGWFENLWSTLTEISIGYILLGCLFQAAQTMLTALGWYGILRYAYPGGVTYMPVLAAYATGVALNNFVPANMGTFVMLLMFVAIVQGSTFPGVLGGYVVQKIFYFVIGTLIYVYLFSQVAGSFDYQFGNERDAITSHPVLTLGIVAGAIFLLVLLGRLFWAWVKKMWAKAMQGAAILGDLGAYVKLVLLPQMGGYAAKVARDHRVPRGVRHPRHLRLGHERARVEPAREHRLLHAGRDRREPGVQLVCARGVHRHDDRDRVLARAAAGDDGLQRRLRDPSHLRRLRLARRLEAREGLVRGREGEEGRDGRGPAREARGEARGAAGRGPQQGSCAGSGAATSRRLTRALACERVDDPCAVSPSLAGFIGPRVALFVWWVFGNKVDAAFDTWIWPLLGLIFLPWTTLAYVLAWGPINA